MGGWVNARGACDTELAKLDNHSEAAVSIWLSEQIQVTPTSRTYSEQALGTAKQRVKGGGHWKQMVQMRYPGYCSWRIIMGQDFKHWERCSRCTKTLEKYHFTKREDKRRRQIDVNKDWLHVSVFFLLICVSWSLHNDFLIKKKTQVWLLKTKRIHAHISLQIEPSAF